MKAVLCRTYSGIENLEVGQLSVPVPAKNEVLIKVCYSGVNFPDTLIVQGKYQFKPDFPFSPGQEVAGIVEEVGDLNSGFRKGDSVLASMTYGGMAGYAVAEVSNTYLLPSEIPLPNAAVIIESFATAFHSLKDRALLTQGKTLVVLGAAGGTGMAAVQLGKIFGCRVIGVGSTPEKRDFISQIGADLVLPYENLKIDLKELGGCDVVFDPVGGKVSETAFRTLKPEGKHLVIGFASGIVPTIPWNLPLLKSADIVGVFWGRFWRENPEGNRRNIELLLKWFCQGKLQLPIPKEYRFEDAITALNDVAERRAIGKIVLKH